MVGGRGVLLAKDSVVREGEFLLALRCADGGNSRPQSETRVLWASMVEKDWLEEDLPHLVKERSELRFDQDQEKVVAASCRVLLDLPLETPRRAAPAADEASELLARVVRDRVTELIASQDEAHRWVQRVRCLGDWLPQLELPRYDSEQLAAALTPLCHGRTSLRALRDQNLAEWLRSQLPFELRQRIDREAPDRFQVPSGSSLRLHYERGQPALLSVRIQELFGLPDTPRIAAGSVPILLELLGPHGRPVQRTQDLKNFWTQTYAQVRKDLRGRYPKHSWPEDPLTAEPVRGVRRRR
jgi:ATP-dependent helicase HrpB